MKETGIIRRIDELGRVVIPKEIRKTLRIAEGDPLEIFTEHDELLLRKYSPLGAIQNYTKCVIDSLYDNTQMSVLICDTDKIIGQKGSLSREFDGKLICDDLLSSLKSRKTIICDNQNGQKVTITDLDSQNYKYQLIMPIISQGDLYGGLILISIDREVDSKVIALASFCIDFLARV